MPKFIVMEASAATPASWKWSGGPRGYRRLAVVETDGTRPKMISARAKGMVRIVRQWDRLYQGKGQRSEYARALEEAENLAELLNAEAKKPPDKPAA